MEARAWVGPAHKKLHLRQSRAAATKGNLCLQVETPGRLRSWCSGNLGCHMAQLCCPSISILSHKQKGFAKHKDPVLSLAGMQLQVCILRELACSRLHPKGASVGQAHPALP